MNTFQINNQAIRFCPFELSYLNKLMHYLQNLSAESKSRFGPHAFTYEAISQLHNDNKNYKLFVAKNEDNDSIVAYTIIKMGWLDFEYPRLSSYGLLAESSDCTFAPSVADEWQSMGLGSQFMGYLIDYLKNTCQIKRIFLWGGVQASNTRAINLYRKFGFGTLGQFEYNGLNEDMFLEL